MNPLHPEEWMYPTETVASGLGVAETAAVRRRDVRAGHRSPPGAAWWIAAAAIIGPLVWAGFLQAQKVALESQRVAFEHQAERYEQAIRVLASPGLIVRRLLPPSEGPLVRADLYLDPASETGIVVVHGFAPPASGRAWHVWFGSGEQRLDAGPLQVDASGSGSSLIPVPADLASYQRAWIAEEPANNELPSPSWIVSGRL